MTIILPALAVAFAALCVWLGVRIFNRRERWAKWTLAVVIAMPVLYVLSFGPACLYLTRHVDEMDGGELVYASEPIMSLYGPLGRLTVYGPRVLRTPIHWYLAAWTQNEYPNSDSAQYVVPLGDAYIVCHD